MIFKMMSAAIPMRATLDDIPILEQLHGSNEGIIAFSANAVAVTPNWVYSLTRVEMHGLIGQLLLAGIAFSKCDINCSIIPYWMPVVDPTICVFYRTHYLVSRGFYIILDMQPNVSTSNLFMSILDLIKEINVEIFNGIVTDTLQGVLAKFIQLDVDYFNERELVPTLHRYQSYDLVTNDHLLLNEPEMFDMPLYHLRINRLSLNDLIILVQERYTKNDEPPVPISDEKPYDSPHQNRVNAEHVTVVEEVCNLVRHHITTYLRTGGNLSSETRKLLLTYVKKQALLGY